MATVAACNRSWQECRTTCRMQEEAGLLWCTTRGSTQATPNSTLLCTRYLCSDNDPYRSQRIKGPKRMLCGITLLRVPYGNMQQFVSVTEAAHPRDPPHAVRRTRSTSCAASCEPPRERQAASPERSKSRLNPLVHIFDAGMGVISV